MKKKYSKQQNYCILLLKKSKKNYYSNLNEKTITDKKTFQKTVKAFLSDKNLSDEKITLIEKDKIIKTNTKAVNMS